MHASDMDQHGIHQVDKSQLQEALSLDKLSVLSSSMAEVLFDSFDTPYAKKSNAYKEATGNSAAPGASRSSPSHTVGLNAQMVSSPGGCGGFDRAFSPLDSDIEHPGHQAEKSLPHQSISTKATRQRTEPPRSSTLSKSKRQWALVNGGKSLLSPAGEVIEVATSFTQPSAFNSSPNGTSFQTGQLHCSCCHHNHSLRQPVPQDHELPKFQPAVGNSLGLSNVGSADFCPDAAALSSPPKQAKAARSESISSQQTFPAHLFASPGGVRSDQWQSRKYKTELCRSWEEVGICSYGLKCQYAHGPGELRRVERHPMYKTQMCKAFVTTGQCSYGKRCTFLHSPDEKIEEPVPCDVTRTPLISRVGLPQASPPFAKSEPTLSAMEYDEVMAFINVLQGKVLRNAPKKVFDSLVGSPIASHSTTLWQSSPMSFSSSSASSPVTSLSSLSPHERPDSTTMALFDFDDDDDNDKDIVAISPLRHQQSSHFRAMPRA